MLNLDITKCNIAIDKLLETTTNPRHRYILMSYARHRHLEFSGHYDEVLTDEMMSDHPQYTIRALGVDTMIDGKDQVRIMYKNWAETNQCVFYIENEQVAVADNFVASKLTSYQQIWGGTLAASKVLHILPKGLTKALFIKMLEFKGLKAELDQMYLYKTSEQWFWPYDERCRLMREDILEPDRNAADIIKLDAKDVLTAAESSKLLMPLIKPLPNFDEYVLGKKPS
ncbi:MAG: hypothetical protein ABJF01_05425 [bacterium]